MILYTPTIILVSALACLAAPVKNLPAADVSEPVTEIAIPTRKNQHAENLPRVEYAENWDVTMQNGIMCGSFSSGNAATFYPDQFWALGNHVSLTSPGHYKIATNGASGEGTLVIFFHKNTSGKLTWDRGYFFHDGAHASDPAIVYTCAPKPEGVDPGGN